MKGECAMKLTHAPTQNQRLTGKYGAPRSNGRTHQGLDFGPVRPGVPGDPIYAAADGVVVISKANSGNPETGLGWYMTLKHNDGEEFFTMYGHLQKQGLLVNSQVKAGQVIGYMGHSGSTIPTGTGGTHLHFGVCRNYVASNIVNSKWVDPTDLLTNLGTSSQDTQGGISMKTIKRGSTGELVRILQAFLGLTVDGSFGPATDKAFRLWQSTNGLVSDGSCGPKSWAKLGFVQTKSDKLYAWSRPFANIDGIRVSLYDKNRGYSVAKHNTAISGFIAINGVMFDTKTYQNVTDLIIDGQVNNGGNYSDKGIAFGNPWAGISAYQSTTANSTGKKVDFIGGAPTLIYSGTKDGNLKGLTQSYWNQVTQRMAIGISATALYIITTGQANKVNLSVVQDEGLFQKLTTLINLDGGGSTAMAVGDKIAFGAGRNVPSAIIIRG
jgi:peptidoglycan hydrolase-like protein with peptidoglycan-binding domain